MRDLALIALKLRNRFIIAVIGFAAAAYSVVVLEALRGAL
jgi:hypothetical protein